MDHTWLLHERPEEVCWATEGNNGHEFADDKPSLKSSTSKPGLMGGTHFAMVLTILVTQAVRCKIKRSTECSKKAYR